MPLGQCQMYGTERQGFTRTIATRVDQEKVFLSDFIRDLNLQATHVRSFSCTGRLRNLQANCSVVGLYCVKITVQQ